MRDSGRTRNGSQTLAEVYDEQVALAAAAVLQLRLQLHRSKQKIGAPYSLVPTAPERHFPDQFRVLEKKTQENLPNLKSALGRWTQQRLHALLLDFILLSAIF
jgi:hypothetical protein